MSRSNPTPTNPAQHFMEWSGSEGILSWYNKELKKRVPVKLPFEFLVLDELATITGYSKRDESGYWSNEVRSVAKDEFTVRTKHGTAQVGLYKDLADVRAKGAKYAKSIYIAHKIGDEWVIGNIKASGSALSAWIEFSGTCVVQNGKVTMEKGDKENAPTGEFYPPKFIYEHSDASEDSEAIRLDKELQIYLSQYLARQATSDEASTETAGDIEVTADTPVNPNASPRKATSIEGIENKNRKDGGYDAPQADSFIDEMRSEDVNLDDIPF